MKSNVLRIDPFIAWIGWFTSIRFWKIQTALVCAVLCVLLNNPTYDNFYSGHYSYIRQYDVFLADYGNNWDAIYTQVQHPLTPHSYRPDSHQSKRTFRLTAPLVGKLLPGATRDGKLLALFLFQHGLGILFFYLLLLLFLNVTGDKVFSLSVTVGMAFVYVGNAFFWDLYGWFDGFAYVSLTAALYCLATRRYGWMTLMLLLAYWTDERAIFVSPALLLWSIFLRQHPDRRGAIPLSASPAVVGWYTGSLVTYGVLRWYLGHAYGLHIPTGKGALVGLDVLRSNFFAIPYSLIGVYEGYWLFVLLLLLSLWQRGSYGFLALFALALGVSVTIAYFVFDVTRSMAYVLPLLLLAIAYAYRALEPSQARTVGVVALLVSVVMPNLFFVGNTITPLFNFYQITHLL